MKAVQPSFDDSALGQKREETAPDRRFERNLIECCIHNFLCRFRRYSTHGGADGSIPEPG